MERTTLSSLLRVSISALSLVTVVAACGDDEPPIGTVQIRDFCAQYEASSAFNCCTAEDRENGNFTQRYRFSSAAICVDFLQQQAATAEGRQVFDTGAATSCIAHLNARGCGALPLAETIAAEQAAGCYSVLIGAQDENQTCATSDDCKSGLVCPLLKETGLSFCSRPAAFNQDCIGAQAASVAHPACTEGLLCQFIGENPAGCPSPPCLQYKCIPPSEEGERCSTTTCAAGLTCLFDETVTADEPEPGFRCRSGARGAAGERCQVADQCAEGLYCDTAAGVCAARKSAGEPCTIGNNPNFECRGICAGSGSEGTCAGFCGQ